MIYKIIKTGSQGNAVVLNGNILLDCGELVSVRADIDVSGYFKYYEYFGTGYAKGKEFTHYTVFKGSSEYDTREMSILLDGIVDEAKNLDIPTLDDLEFERLCKEWGED